MNPKLTARDVAVLVNVYKYRYLSVSQVEALHFPSRRTAYRRLQALTALSYLKAFTVPGIPERVYYLDKPGAEVVAGEMHVAIDDLKWHRSMRAPKDYYFLRHFLAINDFRIALTRACQDSPITLLGFIPEYVGEKTSQGNVKKYLRDHVCDITNVTRRISHTPDAAFALEKDGSAALFFAEIDRGIEIVNDPEKGFLKSVVFYLNYFVDGKYQRYATDFGERQFKAFRTLIVTNSTKRLENMRKAVSRLSFTPAHAKRFLWGATNVNKELMFAPIWQSLDVSDATQYKIG
jgi:hypothetical protein